MIHMEKKREWIQFQLNRLDNGFLHKRICDVCGKAALGISDAANFSFTCLDCKANELFDKSNECQLANESHSKRSFQSVKLDVEDFARL